MIVRKMSRRLGFEPPPPGFRTDPGAPPGCFEHSLNILGGKFLLLDQLEGSHLQRCIDVNTKQEFVCTNYKRGVFCRSVPFSGKVGYTFSKEMCVMVIDKYKLQVFSKE